MTTATLPRPTASGIFRNAIRPVITNESDKASTTARSSEKGVAPNWYIPPCEKAVPFASESADVRFAVPTIDPTNDCLEVAARFFASLIRMARDRKPRAASDLTFEFFDTRFELDDLLTCDLALQLLNNVNFASLSDTILVAVLAATYPARSRLTSRGVFVDHTHKHLTTTNGVEEADFIANSYR